MNLASLTIFSCIAFGMGYAFGGAKSFGWMKLLVVFVFGMPLLYSSDNEYYTMAVSICFLCGVLVAYGIISFDTLDEIKYRLQGVTDFFNRSKVYEDDQHYSNQEQQRQYHKFYDDDEVKKEQERRQEEAKSWRKKANSKKKDKQEYRKQEQTEQEEPRRRERANHQYRQAEHDKVEHNSHREEPSKPKQKYENDKRTPQEILGLKDGFTKDDVKKAYRSIRSSTHPDKNIGKPQEYIDMLMIEFKVATEAYNKLLKRF